MGSNFLQEIIHHLILLPILLFCVFTGVIFFELARGIFKPNAAKFGRAGFAMIGCFFCLYGFGQVLRFVALREFGDCQANVKALSVACSSYASDNAGAYPESLQKLVPKYLSEIPVCPTTRTDTYSPGFVSTSEAYTLSC